MPGSAIMRERRERWARLKVDRDFLADCIERVALGESIRALAIENDLPYNTFWDWLTNEHGQELARARKARASGMVEANEAMADKVEAGKLDPKRATAAGKLREWIATRYDRDTFGDRSAVDMRVTGTVDMHVQAVRQLTQGATYDHDGPADSGSEPIDVTPVDEHPLL